jgi:hypothetical protein
LSAKPVATLGCNVVIATPKMMRAKARKARAKLRMIPIARWKVKLRKVLIQIQDQIIQLQIITRADAMIVASVAIVIEIEEIEIEEIAIEAIAIEEIADAIVTAIVAEIANVRSQFLRMMSCYQLAAY